MDRTNDGATHVSKLGFWRLRQVGPAWSLRHEQEPWDHFPDNAIESERSMADLRDLLNSVFPEFTGEDCT